MTYVILRCVTNGMCNEWEDTGTGTHKPKMLARQDKTLFTLGPLLNGVGGIYTKHFCKTRDKMVEKHITKYLKIQNRYPQTENVGDCPSEKIGVQV